ncbi:AAEL012869-PA [Aedes aegypti]|uniref:AAEL012869-PA n=1 Tax=Aedes aegypti TaxID=7159 RepID=Q16KV6_AEDAE|nr:AAEL012869-PA [Aedes aegypti]
MAAREFEGQTAVFRKIPARSFEYIGFRMLQKKGWSGKSLGINEEAIIGLIKKVSKFGLGVYSQLPGNASVHGADHEVRVR